MAWIPKVVVVAGMSLAMVNVLLVPLDVAVRRAQATLALPALFQISFMLTCVYYLLNCTCL